MNVEVLFIRRPDELICGEDKPFDSRLEEDLLEEWRYYEKQPLRSSAFSWKVTTKYGSLFRKGTDVAEDILRDFMCRMNVSFPT